MDNPHLGAFGTLSLKEKIKLAVRSFTKRQFRLFAILASALTILTLIMVHTINNHFLVMVPTYGGTLNEGVIGTPRFVNPLLAASDADRDLTSLVYSGLMKKNSDGELIPDLALSYDISKDGLTYTFKMNPAAKFQDNTPVTADDVIFTINKAQDPALKSVKRVNWEGVAVSKGDDETVIFTLKHPFASFLENATLGILPMHIWKNVGAEEWNYSSFNTTQSVGSGPYQIYAVVQTSSGIPGTYELRPFSAYTGGKAYIKKLNIHFYANEKELVAALSGGQVDQATGLSSDKVRTLSEKGFIINTTVLPRVFGIFFNQTQAPIFTDHDVIRAFDKAINKKQIVEDALLGYGVIADGPLPPKDDIGNDSYDPEQAKQILAKAGWTAGPDGVLIKKDKNKKTQTLSFSLSTGDTPELQKATERIKEDLENIGARVDVKIFEVGTLNQNVIRPRKYDALFFGEIVNRESDLFAFWHSSQRNDPGLNIALYANPKTDKLLEDAVATVDAGTRDKKLTAFADEIKRDSPAVFIYSPDFTYVTDGTTMGMSERAVAVPSDRFATIREWYTAKDYVWKIFSKGSD